MRTEDLKKSINSEFRGTVKPHYFAEHETGCSECIEVNAQLKKFADKLEQGAKVVRHPGPDLLLLNGEGLKYVFPYLAEYVLENKGEDVSEFASDLVETYLSSVLKRDGACFTASQLKVIKDFSLYCIESHNEDFKNFGFTEGELSQLKKKWST